MSDNGTQEKVFDTGLQHLGNVYAKAFFSAVEKAGNTDEAIEQFDSLIDDVIGKMPQLDATLCSPRIPLAAKTQMLDRAFAGKVVSELLNFLKVVASHGRFECLRAIRRSLRELYNESRNRVEVQVRTAEALTEGQLGSVINRLKQTLGLDVVVKTQVDPDLIGGLVVRVGDTVFDGSVANQLVHLRKTAVDKAVLEIRQSLDRFVLAD